jgi:YesN/AraC family two-component response regulator
MEEEQLFLRSDLKVQDVATALDVPRTAVSNCIHDECNSTFNAFVNTYRIAYVQRLMLEQPDAKVSSLYLGAGFANETSFFRTFKDITGKTPGEWRSEHEATST